MENSQKVDQLQRELEQIQNEFEELDLPQVSQKQTKKDIQEEDTIEHLRKNYLKLHTEKMYLLEKLEARDEELKQLRDQSTSGEDTYTNAGCSLSSDGVFHEVDIVRLREVVEHKQRKIESLEVQLTTFQAVANAKERLRVQSQDQSRIAIDLRKELEAAKVCGYKCVHA